MTSVIAWLAVDSRQPTGLYFASDSRRSFANGEFHDDCVKLYAPEGSEDIFAFSGDVEFAQGFLSSTCSAIEADQVPYGLKTSPHGRAEWIEKNLRSKLLATHGRLQHTTTILYGTRYGWGPQAVFYLTSYRINASSAEVSVCELSTEVNRSSVIELSGSGVPHVRRAVYATTAVAGDFSRAFFAGFCDSVLSGNDVHSGGAIQVVSIGCKSTSRHIGVVLPQGAYYRGQKCESRDAPIGFRTDWRNIKFERVLSNGELIRGAQRHGWRPLNKETNDSFQDG
ncbi:MAG: hypothetical protein PHI64_15545 [Zoogloea sp.]|uniref:hypothetical protein n=1 Tax=Zoogloea sp. TaxID=49181 RepID=UPI002602365E|nr:hypothetical protein [Zoogloea sp.]MDD2990355.1 hypothetical protein [Zoogloea sp.]